MKNQDTDPNQEVYLSDISQKIKGYFVKVNDSFFDAILFAKRNIIIIALLIAAGVGLGIYRDSGTKSYTHKIFVIPNFGSVDYLYEEVEAINTKIKEHDTVYLKQLGITKPKYLSKIEIEPVVDIYEFIDDTKDENETDRKFQVFKLISEGGEMGKMLEDPTTSKNYKNHIITITTKGRISPREIIAPVLTHFNANPYLKQLQQEYINNIKQKTAATKVIIEQIDHEVNDVSAPAARENRNLTFYSDNRPLHELLRIKEKLIREEGQNRINLLNYDKVVKDSGTLLNIKTTTVTDGKSAIILPLLFLFIFLCIVRFRMYYRSQLAKRNALANHPNA